LNNGWGVVRTIVDLVRTLSAGEDGDKKYVLVKDPNKQVIRLYDVPLTTFEEDDDGGMTAIGTDAKDGNDDE
jgi:translation initiation factor 3 subunit D